MNIWQIITRLLPFVKPYKFLVAVSLILTLIGAVAAQVNPLVLRYTVDTIQQLLNEGRHARESISLLVFISAILFGKEVINIAVRYFQEMIGEKIRVNLSSQLSKNCSLINTRFSRRTKTRPASCKPELSAAERTRKFLTHRREV